MFLMSTYTASLWFWGLMIFLAGFIVGDFLNSRRNKSIVDKAQKEAKYWQDVNKNIIRNKKENGY